MSVGTFGPVRGASDAELRFQAYTCLAYGGPIARLVLLLDRDSVWELAELGRYGHQSGRHPDAPLCHAEYLNGEVLALAPTLLRAQVDRVYHSDPLPPIAYPLKQSELVESITAGWHCREFKSETDGRNYIMVVNRDFIDPAAFQLKFRRPPLNLLEVSKQNGTKQPVTGYLAETGEVKLDLSGRRWQTLLP